MLFAAFDLLLIALNIIVCLIELTTLDEHFSSINSGSVIPGALGHQAANIWIKDKSNGGTAFDPYIFEKDPVFFLSSITDQRILADLPFG